MPGVVAAAKLTLATLRAGIKLWVLTGDKVETAINIGFAAKLLKPATTLIRLTDASGGAAGLEEQLVGLCETFSALTSEKGGMLRRVVHRLHHTQLFFLFFELVERTFA